MHDGMPRADIGHMRWPWIMGAAVAIGCSGGDRPGPEAMTGSSTSSGMGGSGSTSASTSVAMASTSTGTPDPYNCDPPAAAGSIYEISAPPLFTPLQLHSMCHYRGEVMLIVNTAAL